MPTYSEVAEYDTNEAAGVGWPRTRRAAERLSDMKTTRRPRPIPLLPPEAVRVLYDGTKRVAYALAMETVEQLRQEPGPMLERARAWRRTFPIAHPPLRKEWDDLLDGPVEHLCRELLRLDGRGELLRDTMPDFGLTDEPRRLAIARAALHAHA